MDNRTNTIAGWVLGAAIVALGAGVVSGEYFHAERPEKMGYPIEGVVEESGGAAPVAEAPIETLLAKADPAAGEKVFAKCAACHTATKGGANGIGPNLWNVVGEAIGQGAGGFAFSDALKSKGGNWTFDLLNQWLTSPRKFAEGTKMTFAGLSKGEDRANVIAYLNQQNDSPKPLPTAAAAPAAAPAAATGEAANASAPAANAAAPAPAAAK
jgi:cytochrome c